MESRPSRLGVPEFYEFFAGAGMARAGLGQQWKCAFANDIDPKKSKSYKRNWGATGFRCGDVAKLAARDLPGVVDLAWASFPCQDLSLAGSGAGLSGKRSGTFWPFWGLIRRLSDEGRAPALIVLENVRGTVTSHKGRDFVSLVVAIANSGFRVGAMVIDAVRFVPQSRPRLFIVAIRDGLSLPSEQICGHHNSIWHPASLVRAVRQLPESIRDKWVWWHLPLPGPREAELADVVESEPCGVVWHSRSETRRLLSMMSPVNFTKVRDAQGRQRPVVGTIYKRTRRDSEGRRVQRAEVRFDGIAGCLRTPRGGSSRQTVIVVEGRTVRTRLLAPREAARLMGLPDDYKLPDGYNEAYHLVGDGVVVPVVRYLAHHVLEPVLASNRSARKVAA